MAPVMPPKALQQATHSGRVNFKTGPKSKPKSTKLTPANIASLTNGVQRRRTGGLNEAQVIAAFDRSRSHATLGEPDSGDDSEALDSDGDHRPRPRGKRSSYSREKKILAVQYWKETDMPGKKEGEWIPLSLKKASERLGIDRHCLREWQKFMPKIQAMKKGARRARGPTVGKEHKMEVLLNKEFIQARAKGQMIGSRWFLMHAKALYRIIHPSRITQDTVTGRFTYARFRFSSCWFNGFKKRFDIRVRRKTKQAQKPPEFFRERIVAWLQFNRRMTIILPGSDCGIPRSIDIPCVGRFKLSEIANMDQTPIAFEFLSGTTYDIKGSETIWVKEQRSGWDRRQATLQIAVYGDGVKRCKPLLIFHGDPVGNKRRRQEEKLYDKGVVVAFNKTAWADTRTLKDWIRRQWMPSSAYLSCDKEPRLLTLDAFAPQMCEEIRDEFKKCNTTISIIPGGCTGFVQVLD